MFLQKSMNLLSKSLNLETHPGRPIPGDPPRATRGRTTKMHPGRRTRTPHPGDPPRAPHPGDPPRRPAPLTLIGTRRAIGTRPHTPEPLPGSADTRWPAATAADPRKKP